MIDDGELDVLAQAHGIAPVYTDVSGTERQVSPETKRALLQAIGVNLDGGAGAALERLATDRWSGLADPATVTVADGPAAVVLRAAAGAGRVRWSLHRESGEELRGEALWEDLPLSERRTVKGSQREARRLVLPAPLPPGYHRLRVEAGEQADVALVVAPLRAHPGPDSGARRPWAVAAQLYGIRSASDWGVGDYGDLAAFAGVVASLGADAVSISPNHALFPADPGHFGPYGPSSRAFLNTLHVDVAAVPGFEQPAVQRVVARDDFQRLLSEARQATLVDYPLVSAIKHLVLRAIWAGVRERLQGSSGDADASSFVRFCEDQGAALDRQATFDALQAHFFGRDSSLWSWTSWPAGYRTADAPDVAAFAAEHGDDIGFYRWLQWLADRQLGKAHRRARQAGMTIGLYRDLAVGTHPGGAAAWAEPDVVLSGASLGAPPDFFNPLGQNWGLAALSPEGLRRSAFRPFIQVLRANMRHAGALRIDHVMALERLFWIPAGAEPQDGAYVSYPAAALRALLALESQRHGCMVVGEDLGTVPEGFRGRQGTAGILGYRVLYFERDSDGGFTDPAAYPEDAVASATTHDLPTLAGWWEGQDLYWRRELGLFPDAAAADAATAERTRDRSALLARLRELGLLAETEPEAVTPGALAEAVYAALARSPCRLMSVAAEDLLMEIEQPNLPGTVDRHPNWRRRLRLPVAQFAGDPVVARIAARIRERRGGAP